MVYYLSGLVYICSFPFYSIPFDSLFFPVRFGKDQNMFGVLERIDGSKSVGVVL